MNTEMANATAELTGALHTELRRLLGIVQRVAIGGLWTGCSHRLFKEALARVLLWINIAGLSHSPDIQPTLRDITSAFKRTLGRPMERCMVLVRGELEDCCEDPCNPVRLMFPSYDPRLCFSPLTSYGIAELQR